MNIDKSQETQKSYDNFKRLKYPFDTGKVKYQYILFRYRNRFIFIACRNDQNAVFALTLKLFNTLHNNKN